MPIYEAPGKDIVRTGGPAPDAPKLYVCTLGPSDAGEDCRRCGHPSGSGHGKER